MKTNYKHIIWDWNGTLLDDVHLCLDVLNRMLRRRNLTEITLSRYRRLLDFPVIDFYRRLGFDFKNESYENVADEYIDGYASSWPGCRLHPQAENVLRTIHTAGLSQSVLSAYQQQRLEEAIDYFGLRPWFVRLIGLNDPYAAGKTDNGKRWMQQLDHSGREVLLIGDTVHDAQVAQAMGADCALTTFGHNSKKRLRNCGVRLFDSLEEIRKVLTD